MNRISQGRTAGMAAPLMALWLCLAGAVQAADVPASRPASAAASHGAALTRAALM